jgi:molybdate transport system substrate-binding protein
MHNISSRNFSARLKKISKVKIIRFGYIIGLFFLCAAIFFYPGSASAGEINISLASSLKDAITELSDAFIGDNPGIVIKNNSGASGALAKQIENGAPSDIFISANLDWMNHIKDKGLVQEKDIRILAHNILVFIGAPNPKIKAMKDLILLERIAIASPGSAPAGEYAMEAIKKAGIENELGKKLVFAKDVRECLIYVERSEVDGAFVYKTDTHGMSNKVKVLFETPQELYPRITYPIGLTAAGANKQEAKDFFKFLQAETSKKLLEKYGFLLE